MGSGLGGKVEQSLSAVHVSGGCIESSGQAKLMLHGEGWVMGGWMVRLLTNSYRMPARN